MLPLRTNGLPLYVKNLISFFLAIRNHFFINAVKEVTRKNAQSYLEESHIEHISSAYKNYADEENYARVVSFEEIAAMDFSLNIALYVRDGVVVDPVLSVEECIDDWMSQSATAREETDLLIKMLTQEEK